MNMYTCVHIDGENSSFISTQAHTADYIPFHSINFLIEDTLLLVHIADHRSHVTNYRGEYENS